MKCFETEELVALICMKLMQRTCKSTFWCIGMKAVYATLTSLERFCIELIKTCEYISKGAKSLLLINGINVLDIISKETWYEICNQLNIN